MVQISLLGLIAMTSPLFADPQRDAAEILQLLLNARQLNQYFHFDTHPHRAPLTIVNRSGVDLGAPRLTAAGQKAIVVTEGGQRPLQLKSFKLQPDKAEIAFAFPAEGVTGEGRFARTGDAWTLDGITVREH